MSALTEYFEYLDHLRASGKTNMFGAAPYLCQEFGLEIRYAREILGKWSETFDPSVTAEARAAKAGDA